VVTVVIISAVSECYVAPPSDDHSYANCTSTLRPAAAEPQHPSLFRQSTSSNTCAPCTSSVNNMHLFQVYLGS